MRGPLLQQDPLCGLNALLNDEVENVLDTRLATFISARPSICISVLRKPPASSASSTVAI